VTLTSACPKGLISSAILVLCLLPSRFAAAEDLTHCRKAMRQFESGSTELAATLFSRCLRDGRLTKVNQALIHEYRGRALLKTGRVEDAITDFSHAISLTPSFALAYFSRGNAYAR
jgi:tetratricopeptide (TPR) repeat protein